MYQKRLTQGDTYMSLFDVCPDARIPHVLFAHDVLVDTLLGVAGYQQCPTHITYFHLLGHLLLARLALLVGLRRMQNL